MSHASKYQSSFGMQSVTSLNKSRIRYLWVQFVEILIPVSYYHYHCYPFLFLFIRLFFIKGWQIRHSSGLFGTSIIDKVFLFLFVLFCDLIYDQWKIIERHFRARGGLNKSLCLDARTVLSIFFWIFLVY